MNQNVLTKEIIAANNNIFTRRSSNCSRINSQSFLPSSAGISRNYSCLAVIVRLYSDAYHYIHKYWGSPQLVLPLNHPNSYQNAYTLPRLKIIQIFIYYLVVTNIEIWKFTCFCVGVFHLWHCEMLEVRKVLILWENMRNIRIQNSICSTMQ